MSPSIPENSPVSKMSPPGATTIAEGKHGFVIMPYSFSQSMFPVESSLSVENLCPPGVF
jgi:hypothetical protein